MQSTVNQTSYFLSVDSVSRLEVPDRNYSYFKISNLRVSPSEGLSTSTYFGIPDPVFILDTSGLPYLHFMQDALGQFLLLRKLVPQLKLRIVANTRLEMQEFYDRYRTKYYWPLFTEFSVNETHFLVLDEARGLSFSDVYMISPDSCMLMQDLFNRDGEYFEHNITSKTNIIGSTEYEEYRVDVASQLNCLLSAYKTPFSPNRKIFISREAEDSTARAMETYVNMYNSGIDVEVDEDASPIISALAKDESSLKFYSEMLRTRVLPSKDMHKIMDYYKMLGYSVVKLEELSLIDQVFIMSGATHVAALPGSGIYNCIYCSPETKIDIIVPSDEFFIGRYDNLFNTLFPDYKFFPKSATHTGDRRYTAFDILHDVHMEEVEGRYE